MSSVDIQGIEEAMKAQQLDQLRGYRQDTYGEVQQTRQTEYISEFQATGYQVLREPLWNKGQWYSHSLNIIFMLTHLQGLPSSQKTGPGRTSLV